LPTGALGSKPNRPEDGEGLALSRALRLYAGFVNARARQTGHPFQGRFGSVALDEEHLMNAARYVALNPVRARLVQRAEDWPHSSVRAHLVGRDDGLVSVRPLLDRAPPLADLLACRSVTAISVPSRCNDASSQNSTASTPSAAAAYRTIWCHRSLARLRGLGCFSSSWANENNKLT
jgi:hypothetical protein